MKRKILNPLFTVMSVLMLGLSVFGVYGFFTAPAKAAAAQQEVEDILRENQEMANEMANRDPAQKPEQTGEPEATDDPGTAADPESTEEPVESAEPVTAEDYVWCLQENFQPVRDQNELWKKYDNPYEVNITGVGDSVMLAALPQLYEKFYNGYFDAVFGRTIYDGIWRMAQMDENNEFGDVILIGLVTNVAVIYEQDIEDLISHTQGKPTFFLTAYGVDNNSRAILDAVVPRHENVWIIDWGNYAYGHWDWILADGLHPNEEGSYALAELVADAIQTELLDHVEPYDLSKGCRYEPWG